jgi:hypothetical protein
MTKVVIDGVEYVPKADVKPLNDERLQACLEILTSMRYFNQEHKMMPHTWEAINAISPELALLEPDAAYSRIHGEDDQ